MWPNTTHDDDERVAVSRALRGVALTSARGRRCARRPVLIGLAMLTLLSVAIPSRADRAHEHGVSTLDVVIERDAVSLAWETPLDGILGFEHRARSEAQRRAVDALRLALREPDRWFAVTAGGPCRAQVQRAASPVFEPNDHPGPHADLEYALRFSCDGPIAGARVQARVFERYPKLREMRVRVVDAQGKQRAVRLTARKPSFTW